MDPGTAHDPRALHAQTVEGLRRYPLLHGAMTRHQSFRGGPMSFRGREYLVELYQVAATEGFDAAKAPQLGLTELLIQLAFHEAGWLGRVVGYALPTSQLRDGFVGRRINRFLRDVPAYRSRLPGAAVDDLRKGGTGSLRVKTLGNGTLQFLGAGTDGDFVEFSADTLILDEFDLCYQASELNVEKAMDRLREGRDPKVFRLGNTELARTGISELFVQGQAREWHWKCPRCNEWQPIDWLESVVEEDEGGRARLRDRAAETDRSRDIRVLCRRCRDFFLREDASAYAWVANHPGRERRSYRMTIWDALRYPLRRSWEGTKTETGYLEAARSSTRLRAWWRGNGARVHELRTGRLTRDDVMGGAVLDPIDAEARATTAGIDVGSLFHIVTSDLVRGASGHLERRAPWVGTVVDDHDVLDMLRRHRVQVAVMDGQPEPRTAARIRDAAREFGCKVYLCQFSGGTTARASDELFGLRRKPEGNGIEVHRTQLLDAAADAIRQGRELGDAWREDPEAPPPDVGENYARLWPCDVDTAIGFVAQVCEPVRSIDDKGRAFWTKTERADHYRLADAYDLAACILFATGGNYGGG